MIYVNFWCLSLKLWYMITNNLIKFVIFLNKFSVLFSFVIKQFLSTFKFSFWAEQIYLCKKG